MNLSPWHLAIGFFFSNGMPHFVAGVAGKRFRSPLGANSPARVNLVWGLVNFALGTALVLWKSPTPQWQSFLLAYWLIVAMFGFGISQFKGTDF
jgi:hypothetical protein